MESKPLILYCGNFLFPDGDAAAARVLGIGCALRDSGYEVLFGGGESEGRAQDRTPSGAYVYRGFPYKSQGALARGDGRGLRRLVQIAEYGTQVAHWVQSYRGSPLAAVIAYAPTTPATRSLRHVTRNLGVPLLLDLTEWHTGDTLPGGALGYRNFDSQLRMRLLYPRADGVIAISSLLQRHYHAAGCDAIRVPPLVDLEDPKWSSGYWAPSDALRLVYAGNPGNKDLLGAIIRAVVNPRYRTRRVELHLVGPSPEQAQAMAGCHLTSSFGKGAAVLCHGRLPQEQVPPFIAGMDFTVLLRRNDRNANAGFATKLVESLSSGVPAIANATSDIAEFIRHGQEGLIVRGSTAEALATTLDEAAALDPCDLARLRCCAKQRARQVFDYRNYRAGISNLVERAGTTLSAATRGTHRNSFRPIFSSRTDKRA